MKYDDETSTYCYIKKYKRNKSKLTWTAFLTVLMMVGRLEPARVASDLDRGRKASKMAEPDECVLAVGG